MTPAERVTAFIAAYHQAWSRIGMSDFDAWRGEVAELEREHFAAGAQSDLAQSMSRPCPHAVGVEEITGERAGGSSAEHVIETEAGAHRYFEYDLVREGDDWRIARLHEFLDPVGAPFVEHPDRLEGAAPDAPLEEVDHEVASDRWFRSAGPVRIEREDGEETSGITVRPVGALAVRSGRLVVGDLGYDEHMLFPLARTVPPGNYPVEVAVVFERHAVLRVQLGDGTAPVARYAPASTLEGGFVLPVDAGNLAVLDATVLAGLAARDKERAFSAYASLAERPAVHWLDFGHPHGGVVVDSGWGDGAYPVYWGLDHDDRVLALYLDFRLAEPPR